MRRYLFAIIPFVFFLPVTAEAQTTTPLEDCLATLEPGEWTTCGGDPIPLVNTSELDHPALIGVFGPRGIIDSWSGAAYTDEYMIFHGGGHDQWGGNEVIAYNYEQLEWERWVDPSAVPDEMEVGADEFCQDPYPDGTPAARHTFNSLSYDPVNNQVLRFGGFPYGIDMDHICGGGTGSYPGGVSPSAQVWSLDLDNLQDGWTPRGHRPTEIEDDMGNWGFQMKTVRLPNGNILVRGRDGIAEYDPNTYEWVSSTTIGVTFHPQAGSFKKSPDGSRYIAVEGATMWWSDEPPTSQDTYAKDISQHATLFAGQGFDYHPASGDVVVWGGGDTVYVWDMDEDTFEPITTVNPPLDGHGRVYSKFKYLDQHDVFIGYNNHNDAVRFYRHEPQDTDPDPDPEPGVFITSFDEPEHTVGQVPSGWTEHGFTNGEWTVGEENGERYLNYSAGSGRYHRMITWDDLDENYNFHVIGEFERMDSAHVEIMPMLRASYRFPHSKHPNRATFYRTGWDSNPGRMGGYRHWGAQFGTNGWGSAVGATSVPTMEPDGTRWCIETRVDDDRVRTRRWQKGGSNAAGPECADGHANPSFWHTDSIDSAGSADNFFLSGQIRLAGSGGLATRDRHGAYRVYNMVWNVEETGALARHYHQDYVPLAEKPAIANARLFTDFESGGEFENFEPATMTVEDNGLGDLMYFDGRNSGIRPINTDPYTPSSDPPFSGGEVVTSTLCRYGGGGRTESGPFGDFSLFWAAGVHSHHRWPLVPIIQAGLEPRNNYSSDWLCDLDENNDPIDVRHNHQFAPNTHWFAWLYTGEQWYLDKYWESTINSLIARGINHSTGAMPLANSGPTPSLNNQQRTLAHHFRDLIRLKATGMYERSPAFAWYYDNTMAALLDWGPHHDHNNSPRPARKRQALDIIPNWGDRPGISGSGTTGPNDDYTHVWMYYWQILTAQHAENLGLSADGWDEIHDWLMSGFLLPYQHKDQGHTKWYPQWNWPMQIHDEPSLFCEPGNELGGQYYVNTPDPHLGDLDTYEKMIEVMQRCQQFPHRTEYDVDEGGNYFPIESPRSWWQNTDQFFAMLDGYAWIGSNQDYVDQSCEMIAEMRMDYFIWYDEHTTFGQSEVNHRLTHNYHFEAPPHCPDGDGREPGYFWVD